MKVKVTPLRAHVYFGNWHLWQPELVGAPGYGKNLELGWIGFELHSIPDEGPSCRRCKKCNLLLLVLGQVRDY